MIDFFFGKPRSGKSYRAMKIIYDQYIEIDSVPDFTNILTNIGGFKFDKVNQYFKSIGSKSVAYKLAWKDFHKHLNKMYEMALDEATDQELNRYAYYHKINDSLIVIDEASFYMKKYDDAISWFLAYHGHFKVRIIIIAQGPKQIYAEYMTHTEIYYEAQPQSKQLKDDLIRYIHYEAIPFNKYTKCGSSSIKTNQKIFDLYKSGEIDKPPKFLYKFILFIFLSFVAFLTIFFFLQYKLMNTGSSNSDSNITQETSNKSISYQSQYVSNDVFILKIRCDDKYCWNLDHKYKDNRITLNYFKALVVKFEFKLLYHEVTNEIYKLVGTKNSFTKKTLAYFTDYYYSIPPHLLKSYLSDLFEYRKPIIENSKTISALTGFTSDPARSALATSTGTQ